MVGLLRLMFLAIVGICLGTTHAEAQGALFTGSLTGYIGAARDGDVSDAARTIGASLSVIDDGGLGAEFDVAHTNDFDSAFFADASMTSFMLNFVALYPHRMFRPFVNVGAGALRVSTSSDSRTEAGWNAGAGLNLQINDVLGVRGDLRYFRLFDRPEDLVLPDHGFFNYWRATVGASFSWPIR